MGTDLLVKVDTILQSKNKPKTADLRYNKAATYAALSYEPTDANWAYWTIDTSYAGRLQSAYIAKRIEDLQVALGNIFGRHPDSIQALQTACLSKSY